MQSIVIASSVSSSLKERLGDTVVSYILCVIFGRLFVKWFDPCYGTVVLSVSLSVTLVYCGQMVGQIKMKLGKQIGLGPGHIVLDADEAPLPQRSTAT